MHMAMTIYVTIIKLLMLLIQPAGYLSGTFNLVNYG